MEVQQSPLYVNYIQSLGWQTIKIDGSNIFIKHIPFLGTLAKIQRVDTLPHVAKFIPFLKKYQVRRVAIEADVAVSQKELSSWCRKISTHCKINSSPFLPTKTTLIDLTPPEDTIFKRFSEAKRRAVRRAQKNNIVTRESRDINMLIKTKNNSTGFLGFITTYGIKKLWHVFSPHQCTGLLAYSTNNLSLPLGSVILLFWDNTAYYWIAGATKKGKKLFVPTLLVWESLKLSKKYGTKQFDFVGVWDERLPRQNRSWLGFTKFKEGFGGKSKYYPIIR